MKKLQVVIEDMPNLVSNIEAAELLSILGKVARYNHDLESAYTMLMSQVSPFYTIVFGRGSSHIWISSASNKVRFIIIREVNV